MSEAGIQELVAAMATDAALSDALGQATTPIEFVEIAAEHGFTISAEDLSGSIDEIPLSDAQLELIGGGGDYEDFVTSVTNPIIEPARDASLEIVKGVGLI